MNEHPLTLAAVLIGGIASGAGGMYAFGPQRHTTEVWLYRSDTIAIDVKGRSAIQPGYDRDTEALKLLDAYRQLKEQFVEPVCRLTAFAPPERGIVPVPPGMAVPRRWFSPTTQEAL
jgi:hypothetical protein